MLTQIGIHSIRMVCTVSRQRAQKPVLCPLKKKRASGKRSGLCHDEGLQNTLERRAMIQTRPLFELTLTVPHIADLGPTPNGHRRIATVTGGRFTGERMNGKVESSPGGDWLLLRPDGVLVLDVRLTLRTHDDALVLMTYRGLRHGPAEVMARLNAGEGVDPALYYFRMTPVFETSDMRYDWLNRMVAVGLGRREATGPIYQVHELL